MKNLTIVAACLVLASSAVAQQGRPGRSANLQPKQTNQTRRGDASDMVLRKAAKEVARARDLLGHALPIYQGHRVAAIQETKDADKEIALGLRFDRNHEGRGAGAQAAQNDNDDPAKHSKEQVARSNRMLVQAGEILVGAKKQLQGAEHDYGGHRVKAVQEIDEALKQIETALSVVGYRR
ncbi:MAG: hypothetical protein JSS65_04270 [Armatimonadetes bacterium]|nr:hypothetical protein [Armatimonadota bacterium]